MTFGDAIRDPSWLAAYGQVAGAFFTLLAVLVALGIARRDARQRRRDDEQRAQAQARLVVVKLMDTTLRPSTHGGANHGDAVVEAHVENLGDRPILDLAVRGRVAAWDGRQRGDAGILEEWPHVLRSNDDIRVRAICRETSYVKIVNCVVSWHDADGRFWSHPLPDVELSLATNSVSVVIE
ncbi:hypothetical protein AB0M47_11390 [Hamadaea sp. NPDC051192]|uniref:hypothetical protein n=1 Tax=Hamadaea sp. NPDC051192 TaxID=3154940 RepID=UPI003430DA50